MRIIGASTWQIVIFVLNALLFTLIGLQLPGILDELDAYSAGELLWWALAVWLAVLGARALWVFGTAQLPSSLGGRQRDRAHPRRSWP